MSYGEVKTCSPFRLNTMLCFRASSPPLVSKFPFWSAWCSWLLMLFLPFLFFLQQLSSERGLHTQKLRRNIRSAPQNLANHPPRQAMIIARPGEADCSLTWEGTFSKETTPVLGVKMKESIHLETNQDGDPLENTQGALNTTNFLRFPVSATAFSETRGHSFN